MLDLVRFHRGMRVLDVGCGKLDTFINQVDAKAQNGHLEPTQASQLLQAANSIETSLGC